MKDAFDKICSGAKGAERKYVSLYEKVPFYGGPEEGGWWGESVHLVASEFFYSEREASAALAAVKALADRGTEEAREAWGKRCVSELDWLEARGLDPDYLPETDGHSNFFAAVEASPGSLERADSRTYE